MNWASGCGRMAGYDDCGRLLGASPGRTCGHTRPQPVTSLPSGLSRRPGSTYLFLEKITIHGRPFLDQGDIGARLGFVVEVGRDAPGCSLQQPAQFLLGQEQILEPGGVALLVANANDEMPGEPSVPQVLLQMGHMP